MPLGRLGLQLCGGRRPPGGAEVGAAAAATLPLGCPGLRLCGDRGHLEVLRWLRGQDPPCPWDRPDCLLVAQTSLRHHSTGRARALLE